MGSMTEGLLRRVASRGKQFTAQVAMSVIAAACAAVIVPRILPLFGQGQPEQAARTLPAPRLATPAVDLEMLFAREQPRPPEAFESAFVEKAAPAAPAVASVVQRPAAAPPQARVVERRRPVVPVPEPRPQAPLELVAMTSPPPAPAAERPKLFGWSLPRVPMEERITGTISSARGAVARLFN
jgi:hypothetical protein